MNIGVYSTGYQLAGALVYVQGQVKRSEHHVQGIRSDSDRSDRRTD